MPSPVSAIVRNAIIPAAFVSSMLAATQVGAVGLFLQPSQVHYDIGDNLTTLQLGVALTGVNSPSDTLRAYDVLMAYNPDVLTFSSVVFNQDLFTVTGTGSGNGSGTYYAPGGDIVGDPVGASPATSWQNGHPSGTGYPGAQPPAYPVTPNPPAQYLGAPVLVTPVGDFANYYQGSLRFGMTTAPASGSNQSDYTGNLFTGQHSIDPVLLFTVTFNVNVDAVAKSSIVLLNDTSYTGFAYPVLDIKQGPDNSVGEFTLPSALDIKVPLPGTLALLGLGLLGMAGARRMR